MVCGCLHANGTNNSNRGFCPSCCMAQGQPIVTKLGGPGVMVSGSHQFERSGQMGVLDFPLESQSLSLHTNLAQPPNLLGFLHSFILIHRISKDSLSFWFIPHSSFSGRSQPFLIRPGISTPTCFQNPNIHYASGVRICTLYFSFIFNLDGKTLPRPNDSFFSKKIKRKASIS